MSGNAVLEMPSNYIDMDAMELEYDGGGGSFSDMMKALGVVAIVVGIVGMCMTPWMGLGQITGVGMVITGNVVE